MKKLLWTQFVILLAGTLFAWTNFGIEYSNWLYGQACSTGCAAGLINPVYTPCFYGAIVFAIALTMHCIILGKSKNQDAKHRR